VLVADALEGLASEGVTTFEVTAIARDGGLGGPDQELLERLVQLDRGRIIASGGIRSIADLLVARSIGCVGAIVGRALYEGSLDLAAAVVAMSGA
jgi:phosphoribosylformimino-5-aminoimidazole carboxamide ribonucleotide (ProFAR) isomerase